MTLVDKDDVILRKVVKQGIGSIAGPAPVKIPGIVFDARAVAQFTEHFDIVFGPLGNALRFHQLILITKFRGPCGQVSLDLPDGLINGGLRGGVMSGRINGDVIELHENMTGDHLDG